MSSIFSFKVNFIFACTLCVFCGISQIHGYDSGVVEVDGYASAGSTGKNRTAHLMLVISENTLVIFYG
ncbi:MAG: hypothetical protein ABIA63_06175, partial [bacterium]